MIFNQVVLETKLQDRNNVEFVYVEEDGDPFTETSMSVSSVELRRTSLLIQTNIQIIGP